MFTIFQRFLGLTTKTIFCSVVAFSVNRGYTINGSKILEYKEGNTIYDRTFLLKDEDFLLFYGIPRHYFDFLIYKRDEMRVIQRGRKPKISAQQEVIMCLYYIRYYPTERCLAMIFGVDRFIVHKTIKRMRKFLFNILESNSNIKMGNYNDRMSESVFLHGRDFIACIDGTEQEVCSPKPKSDDVYRFFSAKKNSTVSTN